nr:hypothetical protein [Pedobacter cryoconitis]
MKAHGAEWVQFDEPFLALDINDKARAAYQYVFAELRKKFPQLKVLVATCFEGLKDNLTLAIPLPVNALHIDLVRSPEQLEEVLNAIPEQLTLSLGIVDGRNIWKNDFEQSLVVIRKAVDKLGMECGQFGINIILYCILLNLFKLCS